MLGVPPFLGCNICILFLEEAPNSNKRNFDFELTLESPFAFLHFGTTGLEFELGLGLVNSYVILKKLVPFDSLRKMHVQCVSRHSASRTGLL